jgi:Na+/melibiose symporter-like transporter
MIRFILARIGCLMMTFGVIVLAVGIAAVQSDQPALNYLFIGAAGTFLGFLLWNRLRERAPRSTRFSMFRRRAEREKRNQDDRWEGRFDE